MIAVMPVIIITPRDTRGMRVSAVRAASARSIMIAVAVVVPLPIPVVVGGIGIVTTANQGRRVMGRAGMNVNIGVIVVTVIPIVIH